MTGSVPGNRRSACDGNDLGFGMFIHRNVVWPLAFDDPELLDGR